MSDVQINFLNSRTELSLGKLDFNKKKKIQLKKTEELSNEDRNQFIKYLFKLNNDKQLLTKLEKQITESISYHRAFLNSNLPPQVDIEIVRETKTEQLEHYLRKDNKFFFKTIQELFLSKDEKDIKNKQDKISAESVQTYSLLQNISRLKLSIDYAKDFNPKKTPIIFDKFLTELRKSVPNSIQSKKLNESSQIITELMVLHESAHIILDNKINKTYLKLAYEIKDKNYDGNSLQQFARLIHEGFADGITTYLSKQHYPDGNVSQCYRDARDKTKHKTEHKDKLNIYDIVGVIDKVINSKEINNENAINVILELSVNNALNKLKEKFKSSFMQDLKYLQDKKCLTIDISNVVEDLRNNIDEQLNNPLNIQLILEQQNQVSKNLSLKSFDETLKIRDKSLNTQSTNSQRKP